MRETRRPLATRTHGPGRQAAGTRLLPEEVAVALSYNGTTHAVMMATPADLVDFAHGFTLTEGIATAGEVESVEVVETPRGIDLQIWLAPQAAARQQARRRNRAGPVGCGLCGIDSLEEAVRAAVPVPAAGLTLTPDEVRGAMAALPAHQPLHDATRAAHAAALWVQGRGIVLAREDVGRHNAMDKLVGAIVRAGQPVDGAALVLTCRTSIDMVQKACALGVSVVIAASAPTAAAVDMAEAAGLTLIGLARTDGFEVFTHAGRVAPGSVSDVA